MSKEDRRIQWINRFFVGVFLIIVVAAIYIMLNGIGTEGKDFGPGAYYYTDIPGWEEIFFPNQSE